MKICTKCKQEKPESEFYKRNGKCVSACRSCTNEYWKRHYQANKEIVQHRVYKYKTEHQEQSRDYYAQYYADNREKLNAYKAKWSKDNPMKALNISLKRRFGISRLDYESMLASQEGRCAICGSSDPRIGNCFCVDHDHKTGKIRGLLCRHCNSLIGFARDEQVVLERAIVYLRVHQSGDSC